jgi:hypothetical protein
MIFTKRFTKTGHTWQCCVQADPKGWIVREESDGLPVTVASSRNWSRIEMRMALFDLKAAELADSGWREG